MKKSKLLVDQDTKLIYTREACEMLGVTRQMVAYYRKKGYLKSFQRMPRGEHRYLKTDVIALLNRQG